MARLVLIRGGGDLASGVASRLHHAGLQVVITELAQPLVVRRMAAFAQAVFEGQANVEGITARLIDNPKEALAVCRSGEIPVLIDPQAETRSILGPLVMVDGRMAKRPPELDLTAAPLVIGLGPGFEAGRDCHAVIETQRGHYLGRAIWQGHTLPDTGIPEGFEPHYSSQVGNASSNPDRVLRAPADGILLAHTAIGDHLEAGQPVAEVNGQMIFAQLRGVLRGLIYPGLRVTSGMKVGDIDPRNDPRYCTLVSEKSLAVGGGVLEAILARPEIRSNLWDAL